MPGSIYAVSICSVSDRLDLQCVKDPTLILVIGVTEMGYPGSKGKSGIA